MSVDSKKEWLFEITPNDRLLRLDLGELWRYRDLLMLLVRRDIVTFYKQTILGPVWYVIQPLFTTVIFTIIFNAIAGIDTAGVPSFLFNLVSVTCWTFFATCLTTTSDTFKTNANLFGKVYFPRIIMPLSVVLSNLVKFGIQLLILLVFYLYFVYIGKDVAPNATVAFFPVLILFMGLMGLGLGMIISSLVTKYRDLSFVVTFGVQLLMYLSAVNYPLSLIREKMPRYAWVVEGNPLSHMIETGRYMLLGTGTVTATAVGATAAATLVICGMGLVIFNKTEKTFIDTI